MRTVVETRMFSAQAARVWTAEQYQDFVVFIASNSDAGAVIPGSGGVRKIRWSKQGSGKRGGVRIIYVNNSNYETWLLAMYDKSERESIPAHELRKIRDAIHDRKNE
jgi:hypothetical protein